MFHVVLYNKFYYDLDYIYLGLFWQKFCFLFGPMSKQPPYCKVSSFMFHLKQNALTSNNKQN